MIIYKATNTINGKSYIGKTSDTLEKRIKEHEYHSVKKDWLFYRAIRKHGFTSFTWDTLFRCDSENELDQKEIELISLNTDGYNIARGGSGGDTFTNNPRKEILRENVSRFHKGKKLSEEHKRKISEAHKNKKKPWSKENAKKMVLSNTGKPSKLKGSQLSEEHKKKISDGNVGKKKVFTEEHKINLSKAGKERFKDGNPNKGKTYEEIMGQEKAMVLKKKQSLMRMGRVVSEETKRKISETTKGRDGVKLTDEVKAKISVANKGKKLSNETKINMSKSHIGRKLSEETKKKISESHIKYWNEKRIGDS